MNRNIFVEKFCTKLRNCQLEPFSSLRDRTQIAQLNQLPDFCMPTSFCIPAPFSAAEFQVGVKKMTLNSDWTHLKNNSPGNWIYIIVRFGYFPSGDVSFNTVPTIAPLITPMHVNIVSRFSVRNFREIAGILTRFVLFFLSLVQPIIYYCHLSSIVILMNAVV